MKAATAFSTS